MTVTYKTENPQEVFDFVVQKLFEQGGRSTNGSICVYRASGGRKCALGWLIPDEEYVPEMECRTLNPKTGSLSTDEHVPEPVASFRVEHNARLIRELQSAHDYAEIAPERNYSWLITDSCRSIDQQLIRVSEEFDLDPRIVNRCFHPETSGSHA